MTRLASLLLVIIMIASNVLHAQVLTEWVESRSSAGADEIALGYPVPIPVDTPLPFDGFRTYAGLHARHQDLALTTPWVHMENIGVDFGDPVRTDTVLGTSSDIDTPDQPCNAEGSHLHFDVAAPGSRLPCC